MDEIMGTAIPGGEVIFSAQGAGLSEGVYRLEATVRLALSTVETGPQPSIDAFLEGSLLNVY